MIKLIAFDMDGTLTDSRTVITTNTNRTLVHFGGETLPPERILCHVGGGAKVLLRGAFREAGLTIDMDKAYSYYDSLFTPDRLPPVTLYPHIGELLERLGQRGLFRAVLSNRPHNQTQLIASAVMEGKLDAVFGQREGFPMKPDPTVLRAIMAEQGCTPDECMYVGDMHFDIETARNAGVRAVGCAWGLGGAEQLKGADHILNDPLELLEVLE